MHTFLIILPIVNEWVTMITGICFPSKLYHAEPTFNFLNLIKFKFNYIFSFFYNAFCVTISDMHAVSREDTSASLIISVCKSYDIKPITVLKCFCYRRK